MSNESLEESKLSVFGDDYIRLIEAKETFGWTLKGNKKKHPRKAKTYKLTFTREKDIPYYDRINELEKNYFDEENNRKMFYQTDALNYILLYLLGLIPGLIYTIVKAKSHKKIKRHNEEIDNAQQAYLNEAKSIFEAFKNGISIQVNKNVPESCINKPITSRQTINISNNTAPSLPSDNETINNLTAKQNNIIDSYNDDDFS